MCDRETRRSEGKERELALPPGILVSLSPCHALILLKYLVLQAVPA